MTEQPRLDVLHPERFAKQRIAEKIDLPDGEIVRGAPVAIDCVEVHAYIVARVRRPIALWHLGHRSIPTSLKLEPRSSRRATSGRAAPRASITTRKYPTPRLRGRLPQNAPSSPPVVSSATPDTVRAA